MANNKDDYLTYYREFFENFAQTVNPHDQLPVKLGSYKLINLEVIGGVIDWTTQYLTQKKCPQPLLAPLIQIIIEETRKSCKKQPIDCGFNPSDNAYEPLKLMQAVMAKTNEICLRYLDNSMLCSLPPPGPPYNIVSVCATRNKRRSMEDRHVVIQDLNTMFNIQDTSPSSYYAIFDGHAGHDAAAYSAAHLHQFLAESKHFATNPEQALIDAFYTTDHFFTEKCRIECFVSGTTAVCALHRPKEKKLYIAWVGDSQALLVNGGRILQCVEPHKPSREDEKKRIEEQGGFVSFWGTWRLNGQLAVSRAIGDLAYKPYVSAIPEIREFTLDGDEDFLILACDGLWDFLSEGDTAREVYKMVCKDPDNTDLISESLVNLSKRSGSSDNISVIVVFLREPSKIAADAHWANRNGSPITMDASLDNANNPFANSNGANNTDNNILQKNNDGLLLNLSDSFKQNGSDLSPMADFYIKTDKSNGKRSASEFDPEDDNEDDDDLGPETDVDAIDDLVVSPSIVAAKALAEGIVNNNPEGSFNPFTEKEEVEKAALEIDLDQQKLQSSEFDGQKSPREETPTPPADAVHDVSGLEENVAVDSGEESDEEEWNYIKGEIANKENLNPTQPDLEVAADRIEEDDPDNMSQLNPNAAEFVPVSPTRNIPSPACRSFNHLNDPVISQSPKRPTEIDINLPNPQDFENEVKSRPSEVENCNNSNGLIDADDQKQLSSPELENILNGKNIDEIPEFQPTTPISSTASNTSTTATTVPSGGEEFHFGPNAAPFTPAKLLDQSEAGLSTKAVYGDESTVTITSFDDSNFSQDTNDFVGILTNKEQDPMSMSFYQDNDLVTGDPFDLNKVQMLPDDLDDYLNKPDKPVEPTVVIPADNDNIPLDNDQRIIQTTDLDSGWKAADDEKELASPADDFIISSVDEEIKNAEEDVPKQEEAQNLVDFEEIPEVCNLKSDIAVVEELPLVETQSPEPQAITPEPKALTPEPEALISEPVPTIESFILPESQEIVTVASPILEPEICETSSPICHFEISKPLVDEKQEIIEDERKEESIESPVEDITSSVKDTASPVALSPEPDQIQDTLGLSQEALSPNLIETSSPLPQDILVPEITSPTKSLADTESVATADVNSFLDRTQISDLQSPFISPENNDAPLQPVDQDQPAMLDLDHPLMKCVYPLPPQNEAPIEEVKTDEPAPQIPNVEILTQTPPSYHLDETLTVESSLKSEEQQQNDITVVAASTVAAAAATVAVVGAAATVAAVSSDKKPKAKPAAAPATRKSTTASPATKKSAPITKTTTSPLKQARSTTEAAKPATSRLLATKSSGVLAKTSTTTTSATKTAGSPTSKTISRPKSSTLTKTSTTTTTTAEKKSLPSTANKTTTRKVETVTKSAAPKPATARPTSTSTTARTATTRPTTAPVKSTVASKVGSLPATKTARPTNLTSKTTSSPTTRTSASTTTKPAPTKALTSPKDFATSKPRPATTTNLKPRVPLTKTITKSSADTEKQNKESANKLTASRTSATKTSTAPRTLVSNTARKTESKTIGNRTTVTKTTTTTTKITGTGAKKPTEITRNVKTNTTTKIEKPMQNGISTEVTEKIEIVNNVLNESETPLVKDNSPVDNKLLVEINTAD